jgi:simple sugar transport system permease protein
VYAIGGSETSAALMGLPVAATLVRVYALSGFCAAMAGLIYSFYTLSGYSLHATGLELDAIAAVVIGGTLLSGGVGHVPGTLVGVLVLGLIQTLISFDGTLSSWWTRIVIGMLLLVFCLLQRLLVVRRPGMP